MSARYKSLALGLLAALLFTGCGATERTATLLPATQRPSPPPTTDLAESTPSADETSRLATPEWEVSTPAEQGLDARLVENLYRKAAELPSLYGLLLVKNGYLVGEDYFNGGRRGQKANLASVTKSYTSALVGIALEQGCLSSVDQAMVDFFPEYSR